MVNQTQNLINFNPICYDLSIILQSRLVFSDYYLSDQKVKLFE